MNSTSWKTN